MTTTTEKKTRTITLTGRAPVKIQDENWPRIARGWHTWHDGEVECQANRAMSLNIIVRRHKDGRHIVYGVYSYSSNWRGESDQTFRAGYLVGPGALDKLIVRAIEQVAHALAEQADAADHIPPVAGLWDRVAAECISNLPAEEI